MVSIKKQNVLLASISYIIFGFVILIILSYQIRTHTAIFVSDGYFHFSRFYDAAQQIKTNNFSFFQSNWGFNQSGRIVNALYGPYFAYLMGAILLICGTWFKFQIVTSFLISFIAATGMYKCLKYVSSNNIANILISLIYITSIKFWSCGSNFNAISSALAPFALYCGLRMILDHKKPISWSQLALTMSIVAQIHLLSTLLFTTLLIPFFIIGLVQTKFRKQMMLNLTVAVLVTLLLTMNIWINLYYFHKLDIVSNPGAFNMYKATLSWHHFTPISICLILVQFLYVSFHWKQSSTNCIITVLALIFLILCTKLFPWNFVQNCVPILKEVFQMPRRFVILFIPLYLLGVGISINEINFEEFKVPMIIYAVLGIALLSNFNNLTRLNNFYVVNSLMQATNENRGQRKAANDHKLSKLFDYLSGSTSDYLPQVGKPISKNKIKMLYKKEIIANSKHFKHKVLSGGRLELVWTAKKNKKGNLPIVMYKQSRLKLNNKKVEPQKDSIGVPTVYMRKGYNKAILSYKAPSYFSIVLIVNFVIWIIFIILCFSIKWRSYYSDAYIRLKG